LLPSPFIESRNSLAAASASKCGFGWIYNDRRHEIKSAVTKPIYTHHLRVCATEGRGQHIASSWFKPMVHSAVFGDCGGPSLSLSCGPKALQFVV